MKVRVLKEGDPIQTMCQITTLTGNVVKFDNAQAKVCKFNIWDAEEADIQQLKEAGFTVQVKKGLFWRQAR